MANRITEEYDRLAGIAVLLERSRTGQGPLSGEEQKGLRALMARVRAIEILITEISSPGPERETRNQLRPKGLTTVVSRCKV